MREVALKLEVMAWDYSAAKGLAKLNFSPSPKETDELLGSPSNAQLLHVRREHYESFGRAELYDDSSLQNEIEIMSNSYDDGRYNCLIASLLVM
ncbi:unnamed protein product [Prunus armeniaca]|uniref:Uncharacterized protein n=1 Tax=Prunus armeniaca TaxID=36596 RepID=A0A6J5WMQ7_PRUAR|nr:unnamed protein product [Prunus armeniaca]